MKKLGSTLIASIAAMLFCGHVNAKIWRVNNTGVPANFTTAQAAHNDPGVVAGDTIHFEPSGTSYGPMSITKRLIIIGNGYHLGSLINNANAGLQANPAVSRLDQVTFLGGSSNAVMMGITCADVYLGFGTPVNGIIFKRNWCNSVNYYNGGTTNCIVSQNYITLSISGITGTHTGAIISHNIIGTSVAFDINDDGFFLNNIVGAANVNQAYIQLQNFIVRNNIRMQPTNGSNFVQCTIQNNMDATGGSLFGNTNGNLVNIDMSTVFAGWPTIGANSFDGRFALKGGSPAAGAGYTGSDMGAILNTGNASNNLADTYVLSGMPNVPSVFKLDAPLNVNTSTLNITVSTKTNN